MPSRVVELYTVLDCLKIAKLSYGEVLSLEHIYLDIILARIQLKVVAAHGD